jgi:S1-C subfamily serine protease
MTLAPRRRRRPARVALVLALSVASPLLAAGPASAAPAGVRPAAAPTSDLLTTLSNLLARLLPAAPPAAVPPTAAANPAIASTVRVNGVACGVRLAGSGFSTAPDTVVTNAHVVAGETTTSVLRPDGRTLPATVQVFDPERDLAVLSVPGLGEPPLGLAPAVAGETDTIFGHPLGLAPTTVIPARVTRRITTDIGDIYNRAGDVRQILVMSADLQPGDSGAPVVNGAGKVVGVAFASYSLARSVSFAVASEELAPVLAQHPTGPVGTGPCIP